MALTDTTSVTLSLKLRHTSSAMVEVCTFWSGRMAHATGDWTIVLLESAALLRSEFIQQPRLQLHVRVVKTLAYCWRKVLTRVRQRRRKDVQRCRRARPLLRSSRGNGFTTSASDSPLAIAYRSWHGLKAMYSHKLVHDRLQKLMRPSCWMSFGRLNNAECSKPRGVYASPAGRYFAMPL